MKRIVLFSLILFASLSVEAAYMKVVNVKTSLNIRTEGSSESPIVGKVENGELVEFISEGDPEWEAQKGENWYQIKYGDIQGWVKSDYVEFTDEVPQGANADNKKSGFSWGNLLPENDYLRLAVYIFLGILGLILLGLLALLAMWLWSIFTYLIGGGALAGIIGFAVTKNADGAFSWGAVGLGLGFLWGLFKAIKNPGDAIIEGSSVFHDLGSIFSPPSSSSSPDPTPTSSSDEQFDTTIKGGGSFGEDLKAKTTWDGNLKDENGRTWKKHLDNTAERID